jgi:outer membrane protein assembly factor BamD (BamD/ComL family)
MKTATFILLSMASILLLTSCNKAEREFRRAKEAHSEQALIEFLETYPKSTLAAEASNALASLVFDNARSVDSSSAYKDFLRRFPLTPLSANAQSNLIRASFAEASNNNSVAALKSFVEEFTNSAFSKQATETIERLEYEQALKVETVAAYQAFLSLYTNSPHASEIRNKLDSLLQDADWRGASTSTDLSAFLAFQKKYPKSDRVKLIPGAFKSDPEYTYEVNMADIFSGLGSKEQPARMKMKVVNISVTFSGNFTVPAKISLEKAVQWNAINYSKVGDDVGMISGKDIPQANLVLARREGGTYEIVGVEGTPAQKSDATFPLLFNTK